MWDLIISLNPIFVSPELSSVIVSPELSSVRDYVITHSVRSMCMYVVFCKIDHCIHIHWCIVMGLGHNDPWVESHMWPQQTWGQRSSRGQWPLVQVFGKKGQCILILDVFSNLILLWLQKYVIAKAGETRGSRTALFSLKLRVSNESPHISQCHEKVYVKHNCCSDGLNGNMIASFHLVVTGSKVLCAVVWPMDFGWNIIG